MINNGNIRRSVSGVVDEQPKCPERSEEYREIDSKSMGRPNLRNERHQVSTRSNVVVRGDEVALRISASCVCGWSSSKIVGSGSDE